MFLFIVHLTQKKFRRFMPGILVIQHKIINQKQSTLVYLFSSKCYIDTYMSISLYLLNLRRNLKYTTDIIHLCNAV